MKDRMEGVEVTEFIKDGRTEKEGWVEGKKT